MAGMTLTAPTPVNSLLWQGINQTYMAALNFGNKSASKEQGISENLKNYGITLVSALSMVYLLRRGTAPLIKRYEGSLTGQIINNGVTGLTVAASSALNLYLTRRSELDDGIEVKGPNGEYMGTSKVAA